MNSDYQHAICSTSAPDMPDHPPAHVMSESVHIFVLMLNWRAESSRRRQQASSGHLNVFPASSTTFSGTQTLHLLM
jgi:hypothetical protein